MAFKEGSERKRQRLCKRRCFGYPLLGFFGGAVVQIPCSHGRDLAETPEGGQRLEIWAALVEPAARLYIHAPCRDVHHPFASAQSGTSLPVVSESNSVERHVLKKSFQCRRETHVPERSGYDNPVG